MGKTNCINLSHFSTEHVDILNSFELPEGQEQFTSLPNKFKGSVEGEYRIVILAGDVPVGFFLLSTTKQVKEYSTNPSAMLLTSFSINYTEQGKGYAKQAMILLENLIATEFPHCNEIVLAVNHKNTSAQRLYRKGGFHDTGKKKNGPIGEQLIMSLVF